MELKEILENNIKSKKEEIPNIENRIAQWSGNAAYWETKLAEYNSKKPDEKDETATLKWEYSVARAKSNLTHNRNLQKDHESDFVMTNLSIETTQAELERNELQTPESETKLSRSREVLNKVGLITSNQRALRLFENAAASVPYLEIGVKLGINNGALLEAERTTAAQYDQLKPNLEDAMKKATAAGIDFQEIYDKYINKIGESKEVINEGTQK